MIPSIPHGAAGPVAGRSSRRGPVSPTPLVHQARQGPRTRTPFLRRQLRPVQVAVGHGVQGLSQTVQLGTQAAAHAAEPLVHTTSAGLGAMGGLMTGLSSPVEAVKSLQDARAGRRKARAAQRRLSDARTRLGQSRSQHEGAADIARHWLDRRHGLESWSATRRCFLGSRQKIQRQGERWRQEHAALSRLTVRGRSQERRWQRLGLRLEALQHLTPRRIARLRSSAVPDAKRLKEAVSSGRNLVGLSAAGVTLALALGAGSLALALVGMVFLPLVAACFLVADGVAGSVEATQLLGRAREGRTRLRRAVSRLDAARNALVHAPPDSPGHLLRAGIDGLQKAMVRQQRQWRTEWRVAWCKRLRSAAFLVAGPVMLGVAAAGLAGVAVTPVGWALAALIVTVSLAYAVSQVVLNGQKAREDRALRHRQKDHARLSWSRQDRRIPLLRQPTWAGNEYLAVDIMVRALVAAARDTPDVRSGIDAVLGRHLGCGRPWRSHVLALAAAIPDDAAPGDPDFWRLSEALMRRFGLPVPKPRHRPGTA